MAGLNMDASMDALLSVAAPVIVGPSGGVLAGEPAINLVEGFAQAMAMAVRADTALPSAPRRDPRGFEAAPVLDGAIRAAPVLPVIDRRGSTKRQDDQVAISPLLVEVAGLAKVPASPVDNADANGALAQENLLAPPDKTAAVPAVGRVRQAQIAGINRLEARVPRADDPVAPSEPSTSAFVPTISLPVPREAAPPMVAVPTPPAAGDRPVLTFSVPRAGRPLGSAALRGDSETTVTAFGHVAMPAGTVGMGAARKVPDEPVDDIRAIRILPDGPLPARVLGTVQPSRLVCVEKPALSTGTNPALRGMAENPVMGGISEPQTSFVPGGRHAHYPGGPVPAAVAMRELAQEPPGSVDPGGAVTLDGGPPQDDPPQTSRPEAPHPPASGPIGLRSDMVIPDIRGRVKATADVVQAVEQPVQEDVRDTQVLMVPALQPRPASVTPMSSHSDPVAPPAQSRTPRPERTIRPLAEKPDDPSTTMHSQASGALEKLTPPAKPMAPDFAATTPVLGPVLGAGTPTESLPPLMHHPPRIVEVATSSQGGVAGPPPVAQLAQAIGVARQLAAAASGGGTRAVVLDLHPEALGQVKVRFTAAQRDDASIEVTVGRAETLALLRADTPALHQALDAAGIGGAGREISFLLAPSTAQEPIDLAGDNLGQSPSRQDSGRGFAAQQPPHDGGGMDAADQTAWAPPDRFITRRVRPGIDITA